MTGARRPDMHFENHDNWNYKYISKTTTIGSNFYNHDFYKCDNWIYVYTIRAIGPTLLQLRIGPTLLQSRQLDLHFYDHDNWTYTSTITTIGLKTRDNWTYVYPIRANGRTAMTIGPTLLRARLTPKGTYD